MNSPAARTPGSPRTPSTGTPNSARANTNIQVSVRCRPLNDAETRRSQHMSVTCNGARRTVAVIHPSHSKKADRAFTFDNVFGAYAKQEEIFDKVVAPLVQDTIAGYTCALFAYGPPGSGKTFTMMGDLRDDSQELGNWGIVPRAAQRLFRYLALQETSEFTVKLSYLEIHNEELRDLLSLNHHRNSSPVEGGGKKLRLMEDVNRGVVCQNQEEFTVLSVGECMELLTRGVENRTRVYTDTPPLSPMHAHTPVLVSPMPTPSHSTSHEVICFSVIMTERGGGEEVVSVGQLRFVDLAG
jgi:kinesin family protein 11